MSSGDDIDEYLAQLDDEQVLTLIGQQREALADLKSERARTVSGVHATYAAARNQLREYMLKYNIDCIKMDDDAFLRLYHRGQTGQKITPQLFASVFADLHADGFAKAVAAVEDGRRKRYDAWLKKQRAVAQKTLRAAKRDAVKRNKARAKLTKRPARRAKERQPQRVTHDAAELATAFGDDAILHVGEIAAAAGGRGRTRARAVAAGPVGAEGEDGGEVRMDGMEPIPDPDDDDQIAALLPAPPTEYDTPKSVRGARQRAAPPFGRPLTQREMLKEALYELVKARHRPVKPVLSIEKSEGRPKHDPREAAELGAEVGKSLAAYRANKAQAARLQADINARRARTHRILQRAAARGMRYVETLGGEAKRRHGAPGGGERSVSYYLKERPVLQQDTRLVEAGDILDTALDEVCKGLDGSVATGVDAPYDPARGPPPLLNDAVMSRLLQDTLRRVAELEQSRTVLVRDLGVRRAPVVRGQDGQEHVGPYEDVDDEGYGDGDGDSAGDADE